MLSDRNIAFFIDIDGLRLTTEQYEDAMGQLENMGSILYGKLYGCGERKHKAICHDADRKGYRLERVKRVKRRGKREFDSRIFVDAVDVVCSSPAIDTVCIVSQPCDMVYLYSYLRERGIKIVALANVDENSLAFIDEVIDLGLVYEKIPKERKQREVSAPRTAAPSDNTDELLREIENLRAELAEKDRIIAATAAQPTQETVTEETVTESYQREYRYGETVEQTTETVETAEEPVYAEEPTAEPPVAEEASDEETVEQSEESEHVADEPLEEDAYKEAKELLDMAVAEKEEEAEEEVDEVTGVKRSPKTAYVPQNDSDLIRKIEALRQGGGDQTPEHLLEEIKKLLDGLE